MLSQDFPDKKLTDSWNVLHMSHEPKKHTPAYHHWIYRNFEKALRESNKNWSTFESLWKAWVRDIVAADPTIVRREYWDC